MRDGDAGFGGKVWGAEVTGRRPGSREGGQTLHYWDMTRLTSDEGEEEEEEEGRREGEADWEGPFMMSLIQEVFLKEQLDLWWTGREPLIVALINLD